jgi:hypothetical protein
MSEPTDPIAQLAAEFSKELDDKLYVIFNGCNALPLQRHVALGQCKQFLLEMFTAALRAQRTEGRRQEPEEDHTSRGGTSDAVGRQDLPHRTSGDSSETVGDNPKSWAAWKMLAGTLQSQVADLQSQIETLTAQRDLLNDRIDELAAGGRSDGRAIETALRKLATEVRGLIGAWENDLREAVGVTNVNVLKLRLSEADAALPSASGEGATHQGKHGTFTDADLIGAGQDWGEDERPLLEVARLVNAYHHDATTLTAAETLAAVAKVLGEGPALVSWTVDADRPAIRTHDGLLGWL